MSDFYIKKDENLVDLQRYNEVLQQFLNGKPIQYIFGKASFFGDEFVVTEDVLIPRNETEEVVDFAIKKFREKFGKRKIQIADVCAGSGCIGCELFKNSNVDKVYFSDISEKALKIAIRNASNFKVRGEFFVSDGLDYLDKKVDVIVSNPPYILNRGDVDQSVLKFEPHNALFTDDNLTIYKNIIEKSKLLGVPLIIFEIGYDLVDKLESIIKESAPEYRYEFIKDINGKFRICSLERIL